jgi:hypothetical protein
MGNRTRRELEGAAMLRAMLAHPPREKPIPYYEVCGEPAAIDTYTWHRTHYFCEAHRAEADIVFEK